MGPDTVTSALTCVSGPGAVTSALTCVFHGLDLCVPLDTMDNDLLIFVMCFRVPGGLHCAGGGIHRRRSADGGVLHLGAAVQCCRLVSTAGETHQPAES